MSADNLQIFTRCPHCRTMFRMATQMPETDEDWVKCGRCKKVFASSKNQIDPTDFLKPEEKSDFVEPEVKSGNQTETTKSSSPSVKESLDDTSIKTKPEGQIFKSDPRKQLDTTKSSSPLVDKKSDAIDSKLESKNQTLKTESGSKHLKTEAEHLLPTTENTNQDTEQQAEHQLSFIKKKKDKVTGTQVPQAPLFNTKSIDPKTNESVRSQTDVLVKPAESAIKSPQLKPTPSSLKKRVTLNRSDREISGSNSEKPAIAVKPLSSSATPTREKTLAEQQKINAKAEKKRKAEKSQWTKMILAQAQSWKSEKNRFQSRRSYTGILAIIGLLALLIWQVAIVNYSKLANYNFLQGPLSLTCAVLSCNKEKPASEHVFEILHANFRRHKTNPGVVTISANLINYSNSDKLLPSIRLDLTDANEVVVASQTINLVENPQYIDPAISLLSPGQDVKLKLDLDRPIGRAVGFELSVIN